MFGWIAIRRQGIYFAMITLALAQMVYFVASASALHRSRRWHSGRAERTSIRRDRSAKSDLALYCVVVVIFLAGCCSFIGSIHSPFGQVLKSIRENEARAISLGYDTDRYKLLVFVISAGLAGIAGATKVIVLQLASLTDVHWSMSGEVVLMTLVGGMGTIFGPIVGALIMVLMQSYLAHLGAWIVVIQGLIFHRGRYAVPRGNRGRRLAHVPTPTLRASLAATCGSFAYFVDKQTYTFRIAKEIRIANSGTGVRMSVSVAANFAKAGPSVCRSVSISVEPSPTRLLYVPTVPC